MTREEQMDNNAKWYIVGKDEWPKVPTSLLMVSYYDGYVYEPVSFVPKGFPMVEGFDKTIRETDVWVLTDGKRLHEDTVKKMFYVWCSIAKLSELDELVLGDER